MRRGKKSVVHVAQRVAPLVPVQGLPSFFPNMYCLFDPSSTFVGFSVQNSGGRLIDHVVVMRCMIGKDSPGNEEASSSCCNETSKDFEITTGATKG